VALLPYLRLSIALSLRLLRPRAKAVSNSRCRCCHSRSSACLGDVRNDEKCIICFSLEVWCRDVPIVSYTYATALHTSGHSALLHRSKGLPRLLRAV
jgi:hypothetical protein